MGWQTARACLLLSFSLGATWMRRFRDAPSSVDYSYYSCYVESNTN